MPYFLIFLLLLFFTGCTTAPVRDSANKQNEICDSLRAKFTLTLFEDSSEKNLDAVMFAVPKKRYRIELTGPLGIGVASMLWTENSWQVTFPTEKLYVKGKGYMVGLVTNNTLPFLHIHQVAALFNGNLLPERYEFTKPSETLDSSIIYYARESTGRPFEFAKINDNIIWLKRTGQSGKIETLHFFDFKEFEGVFMPSKIVFELDSKKFLEINVKKVNRKKTFSPSVWHLNIPKSFKLFKG